MKRFGIILTVVLVLAVASAAMADKMTSLQLFGPGTPLNELLAQYYKVETAVVTTVAQDSSIVEDVITTFEVARLANADPIRINLERRKGRSWASIINEYRVNPTLLFSRIDVPIGRLPANYQQMYREYSQASTGRKYTITLYDNNVRALANMKFLVERFKYQPLNVMNKRTQGISFIDMIAAKYDIIGKDTDDDD